jgi:peptide deformylase
MAVLPIRISGDPVLHTPATEVTVFDDDLRTLVADMMETMARAPGVGLAAPQVGVPLRLFVYAWTDADDVRHEGVAVNPVLWVSPVPTGDPDEDEESEGCLSFPGERFALRRSEQALLQAVDENQEPFEVRADGWLARIFQHEFDHLNGILYVDRLTPSRSKAAAKAARRNGWGVADLSWMPGVDHLED